MATSTINFIIILKSFLKIFSRNFIFDFYKIKRQLIFISVDICSYINSKHYLILQIIYINILNNKFKIIGKILYFK
ncbi:LOW QUALITY PROTEIN: hypothetical protein PNEG_04262 [Pneumocystis murina B123]|uniref:Uncharacterized protein n=1 Tax=Pneumocystis murina (strain B123) TaxID=1069680 RepID=A0A0W4ZX52_PNEMU|nr:LOW QUALITY PROTEIN: hypothetical protein PNEG_04262 [Pneumocystis murina B123]KTW32940.1 LOW QUALITY PROTEIN: hypothetical protein PNEG_04262 [Pneumocystis murina B123]